MFKSYLDTFKDKGDLFTSLATFKSNPPILTTDTTGSNGKTNWEAVSDTFFNKTVVPHLLNVGLQLIPLKNDTHAGVALIHTATGQNIHLYSPIPQKVSNMPLLGAMAEIGAVTYIQRMLSIKIVGLAVHTNEHIAKQIDKIPNATQLNTPPPPPPPTVSKNDLIKQLMALLPKTKNPKDSLAFIQKTLKSNSIEKLEDAPIKFIQKIITAMEKAIGGRDGN